MGGVNEGSQLLNLPEYSEQENIGSQNYNEGTSTQNGLPLIVNYVYVKGNKIETKTAVISFDSSFTVKQAADYADRIFPGFAKDVYLEHEAVFLDAYVEREAVYVVREVVHSSSSHHPGRASFSSTQAKRPEIITMVASEDGKLADLFAPKSTMWISNDVDWVKKKNAREIKIGVSIILAILAFAGIVLFVASTNG